MFCTYVLRSLVNDRFYIGSTNDLGRRILEHNSGGSKYTRSTRPFILVRVEFFQTKKEAIKRERFLKTGKGRDLLKIQVRFCGWLIFC